MKVPCKEERSWIVSNRNCESERRKKNYNIARKDYCRFALFEKITNHALSMPKSVKKERFVESWSEPCF